MHIFHYQRAAPCSQESPRASKALGRSSKEPEDEMSKENGCARGRQPLYFAAGASPTPAGP